MPEQSGTPARDYPVMAAEAGRIEPAPRRVRATLGGRTVLDSVRARYVWEFPYYPQYYIPLDDVDDAVLVVWLTKNPALGEADRFDDDHVSLGPLKGNVGDQNYVVPADVDSSGYASVVVWCDRFDVPFGAADLDPSS